MLSILIPVYNINLHPLVSELQPQLGDSGVDYEIIIEDDASSDWTIRHHNSLLGEMENITYIEHSENLGRSKTRNHLADTAKYPYLIFIDCDARIKSKTYIADYIKFINALPNKEEPFAVLGGLSYHPTRPPKEHRLRYKYGIYREVRPAFLRNRNPYQNFTPFNLLISKSVFDTCRFDETLTDYGYEDTFFGMELEEQQIPVSHINNELYHEGLDTNHDFLRKIEASVRNLDKLYRDGKINDRFRSQSRLIQKWERLRKRPYGPFVFRTLRMARTPLTNLMLEANSLKAMDMYKLLLFDDLQHSKGE
jgi:glycosyltransferase involved in cell wall biosynthesis